MPPSNPIELQILDQILTELRVIVAGSDYFFTPQIVEKGYIDPDNCQAYPALFVNLGGSQPRPDEVKSRRRATHLQVAIDGHINNEIDPHSDTIKLLADVKKAVFIDVTHNQLATSTIIESEEMDHGALKPYGTFTLTLTINIYSQY